MTDKSPSAPESRRCQHQRLTWDIFFAKGSCLDCGDRIYTCAPDERMVLRSEIEQPNHCQSAALKNADPQADQEHGLTATRSTPVQPAESAPVCVVVPTAVLEGWLEYWNRSTNQSAMHDALQHILSGIEAVLRTPERDGE